LSRWRKQAGAGSRTSTAVVKAVPAKDEAGVSLFTPVQVVRPAGAERGLVEIVTRSGCVVRVRGAVDEQTLATVLEAVGSC
jgi:hypothetical protein